MEHCLGNLPWSFAMELCCGTLPCCESRDCHGSCGPPCIGPGRSIPFFWPNVNFENLFLKFRKKNSNIQILLNSSSFDFYFSPFSTCPIYFLKIANPSRLLDPPPSPVIIQRVICNISSLRKLNTRSTDLVPSKREGKRDESEWESYGVGKPKCNWKEERKWTITITPVLI